MRVRTILAFLCSFLIVTAGAAPPPSTGWVEINDNLHLNLKTGSMGKVVENAEQALEQAVREGDQLKILTSLHNLGKVRLSQGQTEEACRLFQQALQLEVVRDSGDPAVSAACWNKLAAARYAQERPEQARDALRQALQTLGPDHPFRADVLQNLATVYRMSGKDNEAERCAEEARRLRAGNNPPASPWGRVWFSRTWTGLRSLAAGESWFGRKLPPHRQTPISRFIHRSFPVSEIQEH